MILDEIVREKEREVNLRKSLLPLKEIKERLDGIDHTRDFKTAITRDRSIRLIAEIKHASPLKGIIRKEFDPVALTLAYQSHEACAISVLTDKNFDGKLEHLRMVRQASSIPILRKDFIIDPYQVYESRLNGADAILLIAAILDPDKINTFILLAKELGMTPVVEVHTEQELEMVLGTEAQIIGINNRNLYTFAVDLRTTLRLKPLIPPSRLVVSESGINSREDILLLEDKGIDAVLIGEAILRSLDVGSKIDELLGKTGRDVY